MAFNRSQNGGVKAILPDCNSLKGVNKHYTTLFSYYSLSSVHNIHVILPKLLGPERPDSKIYTEVSIFCRHHANVHKSMEENLGT